MYQNYIKDFELELVVCEIVQLLFFLVIFMLVIDFFLNDVVDDDRCFMFCDVWFNIVVYGFIVLIVCGKESMKYLRIMVIYFLFLVLENCGEENESDIDLNFIFCRGESLDWEFLMKKYFVELVFLWSSEIKGLSYCKIVFFYVVFLVESLWVDVGDCIKVFLYFFEFSMR